MLARISAVLALVALLAAGCTDDDGSGGAAGEFTPTQPDTLTVATTFPAAGFWEGQDIDHLTGGFEFELAEALADQFDLDALKVVNVSFEQLVAGEVEGFDLALAQVSVTKDRQNDVDFSEQYLVTPVGVVAKPDVDVPDLRAAQPLRWGVVEANTEVDVVEDLIRPDDDPRVYDSTADALAGVVAGEVDVVALDFVRALAEIDANDQLELVAQITAPQSYAAVLPKGSRDLAAVDSAVRALAADGTLRDLQDDLYDRYDVRVNDVPTIRVTPR